MHTPRFIIESVQISNNKSSLTLTREQTHHLSRVLRRNQGSLIEALSREDEQLYQARVLTLGKIALCEIVTTLPRVVADPAIYILLGQPKNKCLEQVIQQGSEIGISRFLCFPADFSGSRSPINLRRLELIRDSAAEQACLGHLPQIEVFGSLQGALDSIPADIRDKILCSSPNESDLHQSQPSTITKLFRPAAKEPDNLHSPLENTQRNVEIYIAVGPEGGFSTSEIELFVSHQFQRASFGPYVARVETAVIVAAGISRVAAAG